MNQEYNKFFERFLSPSERGKATHDLASLGIEAIKILESLFSGISKNKFGTSYNQIGALDCGYVTTKLLGKTAKPLESYIREGIEKDHPYAIEAIGRFENIEEETAIALAKALVREPFGEAAFSLVFCSEHRNKKVMDIIGNNSKAIYSLKKAENYLSKNTTKK